MRFQRPELFALLPLFASIACGGGTGPAPGGGNSGASLPRFASDDELVAYLEKHDDTKSGFGGGEASGAAGGSSSSGSSGSSSGPTSGGDSSAPAPSSNETITNNQEAGVDEGGIVKNIDGALVVLRKGRLYAVSIANAGAPTQTDSIAVAPTTALNSNVWYDEMLVRGNQIYVIGYRYGVKLAGDTSQYSYGHGATEVSSFRLAGGKLERQKALYLESNDYFSGSNYASRMIDGKLVFYMPHQAWRYDAASYGSGSSSSGSSKSAPKKSLQIPTYFTANPDGTFVKGAPLFASTDVYVPIDAPKNPVFHTVVKCDLADGGEINCAARSLLSQWGREHYVTPKAVFLWSLPRAYMFRFEDLGVVAHKAATTPTDQFSFKEKDGKLHILGNEWTDPEEAKKAAEGTSSGGGGEAPVRKAPSLVLESLPIADFDVKGEQSLAGKERIVEAGEDSSSQSASYVTKNRFVGDAVFAGIYKYSYSGSGTSAPKSKLVRVELGSGTVTTREIAGGVTRIEPMGDSRALVAIQEQTALSLESLPVSGPLGPQGNTRVEGLTEGESRSHGFFFKPGANTGGTFGLPIMNAQTGGGSYYGGGISNIGFWSVAESGALASLGVVSSSKEVGVCETSCVDWYGNTRPIFIGDRAFALMGSELTEISLAPAGRVGTPAVLSK